MFSKPTDDVEDVQGCLQNNYNVSFRSIRESDTTIESATAIAAAQARTAREDIITTIQEIRCRMCRLVGQRVARIVLAKSGVRYGQATRRTFGDTFIYFL